MSKKVSITTIDNPFNPFDDFTSWFLYDVEMGYYTCSKLARIYNKSSNEELTEKEQNEEFEKAINRLIEIDPLDIYVKITSQDT